MLDRFIISEVWRNGVDISTGAMQWAYEIARPLLKGWVSLQNRDAIIDKISLLPPAEGTQIVAFVRTLAEEFASGDEKIALIDDLLTVSCNERLSVVELAQTLFLPNMDYHDKGGLIQIIGQISREVRQELVELVKPLAQDGWRIDLLEELSLINDPEERRTRIERAQAQLNMDIAQFQIPEGEQRSRRLKNLIQTPLHRPFPLWVV